MVGASGAPRYVSLRTVALAVVIAGLLLVALAGGYLLYTWIATERLADLIVQPRAESFVAPAVGSTTLDTLGDTLGNQRLDSAASEPSTPDAARFPNPAALSLYPGSILDFGSWAAPWAVQPPSNDYQGLLDGFLPIDSSQVGEIGSLSRASRMVIPSIELAATVQELAILDLGDSRAYETPNQVVGHIPETANPGESGNGWFFGHLESPLRGEGSIFRDLPKIPELLRKGERVQVILEAEEGRYLYEVVSTNVLYQDDLRITASDDATIVLVTCVPRMVYDHRLLVTARLKGFSPAT